MPDITMCNNSQCPLSYNCWRFKCPPNQYHQSYQEFKPEIDEVLDEVNCDYYIQTPSSELI